MSDDPSGLKTYPNPLPRETFEEVKARAQRILDLRGKPPYGPAKYGVSGPAVCEDEALILSEFVQFWLPFLELEAKEHLE